jgi:hypothetical protein
VRDWKLTERSAPRKVWRITANAPQGEFVEVGASAAAGDAAEAPRSQRVIIDPAPAVSWRASSHDLLNGVEVSDETDSISGELFDELFTKRS